MRANQEYVAQLKGATNGGGVEEDGKEATNSEEDIDMLDAKTPLLKETNSTIIIVESSCSSNSNSHSNHNRSE